MWNEPIEAEQRTSGNLWNEPAKAERRTSGNLWYESSPLEQLRAELRPLLPQRAFLKRDRGDALLITNAPALGFAPDTLPGCIVELDDSLMRILPDAHRLARLERDMEPNDSLSRSLLRYRGVEADSDNLHLFARGAKLMDAQPSPGEIEAYDRALRNRAALALRSGCGGGLFACACIVALLNRRIFPRA